jgi:hypothetical protein
LQPANEKSGSSSKGFQGKFSNKKSILFQLKFEKNLKKSFRKSWLKCKSPYLCTPVQKTGFKNNKSSLKDWKQQQRFK